MAMMPNNAAKPMRANISGTTALKSAPKSINLLKPVVAQPWGVILARACIHLGRINRGHQQPPRGANTSEVSTAIEPALRSVLTIVASIMPKAEDIITIRMERMITAAGERPRSILKTRIPTVQNMNI